MADDLFLQIIIDIDMATTGKIGVTTENIFPVIKKFLYSDHEIFLRVRNPDHGRPVNPFKIPLN